MFSGLKIGCWFNSPSLGGAERSFVHQITYLKSHTNCKLIAFVPDLGMDENDLVNELDREEIENTKIKYSHSLFSFSRSSKSNVFNILLFPISLIQTVWNIKKNFLMDHDCHWANGNKIGLVLFLLCKILRYKGKLIWHLRDYPTNQFPYNVIWKALGHKHSFKLMIISNSFSVNKKAKELIKDDHVEFHVLYNFMGENLKTKENADKILTIGTASMYAPWKGLHEIIMMAGMYRKELSDLGIEKISLFGGNIYQTAGGHQTYQDQLNLLKKKMNADLIHFEGRKNPVEVYENIDILIHSSVKKEPFGRILVEALKTGIPVISTALGGAGEIIEDNKTGLVYGAADYSGLFKCIERIAIDQRLRMNLKKQGLKRFYELDQCALNQFKSICRSLGLETVIDLSKKDQVA